ncbi:MAG: glycosyltransferase family 2 protein [Rhizomicrobium sp.]
MSTAVERPKVPEVPSVHPASADGVPIDLCICSYKRPGVVGILELVARQTGIAPSRLRVIVADNSADAEMRGPISRAAARLCFGVHYVHAPAHNISVARNACLDAARAPWIAFLDDDEFPSPGWLGALWREVERGGWDAVLGPVRAIYPEKTAGWIKNGDFHSTKPVWVRGEIRTAYTGNVMFRAELAKRLGLRFRAYLGKSGGEDEDFFYRFFDGGGRIGFAADAVVYEQVPAHRARLRWLLLRSFRAGQSHGARLRQKNSIGRDVVIAAAKALCCCGGAIARLPRATSRNKFLLRAALHFGVVAKLLTDAHHIELY